MKKFVLALIGLLVTSFALSFDELVEKKEFKLDSYTTVTGKIIKDVRMGYETYGKLNDDKSNVILVAHYFTGTSHAAGKYSATDPTPGYWDSIIGPGKALDTDKYFIISSDTLVNLTPSEPTTITTGPASINPETKKPYGMDFPLVGIRDFVHLQKKLIDHLGIQKLYAVIGPSGGAMQALDWGVAYPDSVSKIIPVIGPGLSMPNYVIALVQMWASPIMLDPNWNNGKYYGKKLPLAGTTESLKLITLSSVSFDWATQVGVGWANPNKNPLGDHETKYAIEAALEQRGAARAAKIDANSVIYMSKAVQSFNVEESLKDIKASVLFIPASSDLIFPPELSIQAVKKLCKNGKNAGVFVLKGNGGHLDGITKIADAADAIRNYLNQKNKKLCK